MGWKKSMKNIYLVKLYVRLHYMWYYIKHPKMWWHMRKIRDKNLRELMNLYIGRLKMKENNNEINWGLIIVLLLCAYYWVNVYWFGFFLPTVWTIVIASIIGIGFKMWDMRL